MPWINELQLWLNEWSASLGWPSEGILRLLLAAAAGAIIGIEREIRVKHAGFRTMLLVCLGCCLVMLISVHFSMVQWPAQTADQVQLSVDPGRIAYGIMAGIGFLGAGTIIQRRDAARGLTTAAAIWCVAAVGMAIGLGLYLLGAVGVVLVLMALWLLDYVEVLIPRRRTREVTVRTRYRPNITRDTIAVFRRFRLVVHSASMNRKEDSDIVDVTVALAYNETDDYLKFESTLEQTGEFQLISSRET